MPSASGSALDAMGTVARLMGEHRAGAVALERRLHRGPLRADLVAAARSRGYPAGGVTAASLGLFRASWRGEPPPIALGQAVTMYWPTYGVKVGPDSGDAIDPLAAVRHELEHARQMPYGMAGGEIARRTGLPRGRTPILAPTLEVPSCLGDLAYIAEAYRLHAGRPLDAPVEVAAGVVHPACWLAARAREHGYFDGRSMTELLSTPSGRAYLSRLLDAEDAPIAGRR